MQKIYVLETLVLNGTVPLSSEISAFTCKEMRDTVKKKVEEMNKKNHFSITCRESESYLYSSIEEVPIMKENK